MQEFENVWISEKIWAKHLVQALADSWSKDIDNKSVNVSCFEIIRGQLDQTSEAIVALPVAVFQVDSNDLVVLDLISDLD